MGLMGLYESAFSTDSFGKLVFCLSAFFIFSACSCRIQCNLDKL